MMTSDVGRRFGRAAAIAFVESCWELIAGGVAQWGPGDIPEFDQNAKEEAVLTRGVDPNNEPATHRRRHL